MASDVPGAGDAPGDSAGEPGTAPRDAPPALPDDGTASGGQGAPDEGHLHPATVVFAVWNAIRGGLLFLLFAFFSGRATYFVIAMAALAPVLLRGLIRYLTFTWTLDGGEIVIRYGLIGRTERHIPFGRIQDLRIEQNPAHRMLDVAVLHVETASSSGGPEASLSVLGRRDAERLRAIVFARRAALSPSGAAAAASGVLPVAEPAEVLKQLGFRDLVIGGVTSTRLGRFFLLLAPVFAVIDQLDLLQNETFLKGFAEGVAERATALSQHALLFGIIAGAIVVLVGAVVGSAGWMVIVFHGFTLTRTGNQLHRRMGLLTRRESSLPRRRIQVLEIEEGLLRRPFSLAAVRADTAGRGDNQAESMKTGRDVLVPVLPRAEADRLLPVFFPGIPETAPAWRQVSPVAVRREVRKTAVVLLLASGALAVTTLSPGWLALMGLLAPAWWMARLSYRHLGWADEGDYFRTRRGWLNRSTHVVPVRNIQGVSVTQTPFDRRYGVATLVIDTAGQAFTGGGPRLSNVPEAEARALAEDLSKRAVRTRFRW